MSCYILLLRPKCSDSVTQQATCREVMVLPVRAQVPQADPAAGMPQLGPALGSVLHKHPEINGTRDTSQVM